MRPYYEESGITIYHGDCREVLPLLQFPNVAIVSDPPYGINAAFERTGVRSRSSLAARVGADYSSDWQPIAGDETPFDPSHLLSFPTVALFGANHYADKLPARGKWLVWDKRCGTRPDDNSDAELIWTNQPGAVRVHYQKWRGIVREGRENVANGPKLHAAQKPLALMRWVIVQLKLEPDSIIVDPYMGSGTTLRAAKDMGFQSIGIDLLEVNCANAAERMRQAVLPLTA